MQLMSVCQKKKSNDFLKISILDLVSAGGKVRGDRRCGSEFPLPNGLCVAFYICVTHLSHDINRRSYYSKISFFTSKLALKIKLFYLEDLGGGYCLRAVINNTSMVDRGLRYGGPTRF